MTGFQIQRLGHGLERSSWKRGPITAEVHIPIASIDDMRSSLEWWTTLLPTTAREELMLEQARGNLKDPTTIVDGKKNAREDQAKPFGNITYVDALGPVGEAIMLADAIARSNAPRDTGHYARAMRWFVNGQPVSGPPSAEQVGVRGNAELVDLAPYAAMAEIFVPRGVIYAAYNAVVRAFGSTLSVRYDYRHAKLYGGHMEKPGTKGGKFFSTPVLTIGNPTSTVLKAKSPPGYNIRQRSSQARRALRRYIAGEL